MSLSVRIREATLEDNDALIALVRRCPVRGPIHVASDRGPDYFAFVRLQGPRSQIYVAESLRGELVACMVLVESEDDDLDSGRRVLRLADLRTDPAFRHTRVAAALLDRYRERLLESGFACGLVETTQVQAPPRKTQRLLGDKVEVHPEGAFNLYHVPPLFSYRVPAGYHVRPAVDTDLPAVSQLLRTYYSDTIGRPSFAEDWLQAATEQHLSFGLQHLWIVENSNKKLLACAGVWDQKPLRQTLALRFGRLMTLFIRLLTLLGLIWKVPPTPRLGRPLRYAYLRWPAAQQGETRAFSILVRHLLSLMREDGNYQFLAIGLPEGDSLGRTLAGLLRFKSRLFLYSHRVKSEESGVSKVLVAKRRPYVDASLL